MVKKYIQELLYRHDCVIIPGFGGLIANYEGSRLTSSTNTFAPPCKKVAFNESLKTNDGLLVTEIAANENLDRETVVDKLKHFVKSVKNALKSDNIFILEGIGKFFYNEEAKIQFEPENKINYLEDSFGLPEFNFKPIIRENTEEDMKRVPPHRRPVVKRPPVKKKAAPSAGNSEETEKKGTEESKPAENKQPVSRSEAKKAEAQEKKSNTKPIFIVLPIILLVLAGIGALFLIEGKGGKPIMAGVFPGMYNEGTASSITGEEETAEDSEQIAGTDVGNPSGAEDAASGDGANKESAGGAISEEKGRFYVVIGSFEFENNAKQYRRQYSSDGAWIINPRSGEPYYRVAIKEFDTENKAESEVKNLKSKYGSDIWVLQE